MKSLKNKTNINRKHSCLSTNLSTLKRKDLVFQTSKDKDPGKHPGFHLKLKEGYGLAWGQ